ncbi:MAG: methyl-accepting chemotaxis protein [Aliishimia sp.]
MSEADISKLRRQAIDLIASTRAVAVRSTLFGFLIKQASKGTAEHTEALANLDNQIISLTRVCEIMKGSDPKKVLPEVLVTWVSDTATAERSTQAAVNQLLNRCCKVRDAAKREESVDRPLEELRKCALGSLFQTISDFCDRLWHTLDETRNQKLVLAEESTTTTLNTLVRMERIGKHMKLVSLNASVEAARLGDEGRGLGVIATEFKTLAEEIQSLSDSARTQISGV